MLPPINHETTGKAMMGNSIGQDTGADKSRPNDKWDDDK